MTDPRTAAAAFLRGLSRQYGGAEAPAPAVEALCVQTVAVTFQAGEVIFREGEASDRGLLVVEGRLRASLGGRPIGDTTPGDIVGEAAIFVTAGRRSATVTAVEPSVCLALTRDLVLKNADNPALVAMQVHLLGLIVHRIADTDTLLMQAWREAAVDKSDVRERMWMLLEAKT